MKRRGRRSLGLVEDALKLDASDMRRLGVFRSGAFGQLTWDMTWGQNQSRLAKADYLTTETGLILSFKDSFRSFQKTIAVAQSECFFGGYRRWFLCPCGGPSGRCLRRVRCLYLPAWANEFGCRHCHRLIHRSAHEHDARVDELSCDLRRIDEMLANEKTGIPAWQLSLNLKAINRANNHPSRCSKRIYRDMKRGRITRERAVQMLCDRLCRVAECC